MIILFIVLFVCHHFSHPLCAPHCVEWVIPREFTKDKIISCYDWYHLCFSSFCLPSLPIICKPWFSFFLLHHHLEGREPFSQFSRKTKYGICFFVHWISFFHTIYQMRKITARHTHAHTASHWIHTEISSFIRNHQHHLWSAAPNGIYSYFHRDFHLLFKLDQTFNSSRAFPVRKHSFTRKTWCCVHSGWRTNTLQP